jgi:mono/diheme cytochrome c family protein
MRRPPPSPSLPPTSSQPRIPLITAWLVAARAIVLCAAFVPAPSPAQTPADAEQVAKGESVYSDYCWTCHGERLRNPGGGTSFDLRRLRPDDYARFVSSVLNGKNTMPPWRGVLDTEQIDAIWAYIRANVDR